MKKILIICVFLISVVSITLCQDNLLVKKSEPVTDVDRNTYKTIKIGNQIWMAENLKTKHYTNGSPVNFYTYDDKESNAEIYGRLYSSTIVSKKELAPKGWHIPSKSEWEELINYLGGLEKAGGKLKSADSDLWNKPNVDASNKGCFNALPAGMRDFTNIFQWIGKKACFTSSSVGPHGSLYFYVENGSAELKIGQFHPDDAVSVRCIKD